MKSSIRSVSKCAALAAAFLLGAVAPGYASDNSNCDNRATPIGAGLASGGATPLLSYLGDPQPATAWLAFHLIQKQDGSLDGKGTIGVPGGWVEFKITSYMFVNGLLGAGGPATKVHGTPTFGFFMTPVAVGETVFFYVNDDGRGRHRNDAFIEGHIPSWLIAGAPPGFLTTIQQISLPEFAGVPPVLVMRPVTHGDFEVND